MDGSQEDFYNRGLRPSNTFPSFTNDTSTGGKPSADGHTIPGPPRSSTFDAPIAEDTTIDDRTGASGGSAQSGPDVIDAEIAKILKAAETTEDPQARVDGLTRVPPLARQEELMLDIYNNLSSIRLSSSRPSASAGWTGMMNEVDRPLTFNVESGRYLQDYRTHKSLLTLTDAYEQTLPVRAWRHERRSDGKYNERPACYVSERAEEAFEALSRYPSVRAGILSTGSTGTEAHSWNAHSHVRSPSGEPVWTKASTREEVEQALTGLHDELWKQGVRPEGWKKVIGSS